MTTLDLFRKRRHREQFGTSAIYLVAGQREILFADVHLVDSIQDLVKSALGSIVLKKSILEVESLADGAIEGGSVADIHWNEVSSFDSMLCR
jgi:hypothetical protein